MSIRINALPPKAGQVSGATQMATEDPGDETNKTRKVPLSDVTPYTWAASDEDSPLSTGLLYTTEATSVRRSILDVIISLKNAPTGNDIQVDFLKETGVNTNVFVSILLILPRIMTGEFTSETATPVPVLLDNVWELGRRLQFVLTVNDANFAATGIKVTIKS